MATEKRLVPFGAHGKKTVLSDLQLLCDITLNDTTTGITWDLYRSDQKDRMDLKLRLALYPESVSTNEETGEIQPIMESPNGDEKTRSREAHLKHLSARLWDQRKHTGGDYLRMSIVYIALVKTDSLSPLTEQDFLIRPLFRTMKCLDPKTRSAQDMCMVFIDEFGWVYQNWRAFVGETCYPDTLIVAPTFGIFSRCDLGTVQLFYFRAPRTAKQIEREKWTNVGMSVAGLGSTAVMVTAAFVPLTAPLVWSAAAVGWTVSLMACVNSGSELWNRYRHEQSIDALEDRVARAHWLSVTGTALGILASGTTMRLRNLANAGNVSEVLILTANTLNGSSAVVNGVSVGNRIWDITTEDRELTTADILQITASAFLLTHTLYNFRSAHGIVQETQAQRLAEYKDTLGWYGRFRFNRQLNGRVQKVGQARAMGDTIRSLKTERHYNDKFQCSNAFKKTTTFLEDQKFASLAINAHKCMPVLVDIYTFIVTAHGQDYWVMFERWARIIWERLQSASEVSVDDCFRECYDVVRAYSARVNLRLEDVLDSFDGRGYETFPDFVKAWFAAFMPEPGSELCSDCGGCRYEV